MPTESQKKLELVENYRQIRAIHKKLNHSMIEKYVSFPFIITAVYTLGILKQNRKYLLRSEDEISCVMDFILNENWDQKSCFVAKYLTENLGKNSAETEILTAMSNAYTSLFEVVSISKSLIYIKDLLNNQIIEKPLIDIGFSRCASSGVYLFTRLIPYSEFNFTSGVIFAFRENLSLLVKNYWKFIRKPFEMKPGPNDSINRFVYFFKEFRKTNTELHYMDVN